MTHSDEIQACWARNRLKHLDGLRSGLFQMAMHVGDLKPIASGQLQFQRWFTFKRRVRGSEIQVHCGPLIVERMSR